MLTITIQPVELWDEENEVFLTTKAQELQLEHSLVSLSKWESKHHKVFISSKQKTREEEIDYIRCMTLTQNIDPSIYKNITTDNLNEVNAYINDSMTATTFPKDPSRKINRDIITAEIIYYWMIALQIPFECQKWHLNRLLTLINVCNIKNSPGKKMPKREQLSRQRALNEARKAQLNTRG